MAWSEILPLRSSSGETSTVGTWRDFGALTPAGFLRKLIADFMSPHRTFIANQAGQCLRGPREINLSLFPVRIMEGHA